MSRSLRSVVAVSGDRQRAELLDALLVDENEYDVIFVESIGGGYARIKELTPDLVVVCLETDDVAACQLLSMLKTDRAMSVIPVVTWATSRRASGLEDIVSDLLCDSSCVAHAVQMN